MVAIITRRVPRYPQSFHRAHPGKSALKKEIQFRPFQYTVRKARFGRLSRGWPPSSVVTRFHIVAQPAH